MYSNIRWLFTWIIIIMLLVIIKPKKRLSFGEVLGLGLVSFFIVYLVLLSIPIENYFMKFETINEIYKYKNSKDIPEQAIIIEGKESLKLIINEEETFYYSKGKNGYKLSAKDCCATALYHKVVSDCSIHIFRYKKTDDYYISITNISGKDKKISDSEQTDFNSAVYNMSGKDYYYNHGYVYNLNEDYYILINGEKVYFNENKKS